MGVGADRWLRGRGVVGFDAHDVDRLRAVVGVGSYGFWLCC